MILLIDVANIFLPTQFHSILLRPQDPMIVSSLMVGKQPDEVIHPSNSSVRFDLYRWSDNQCPVDYFVISYKKEAVSIFE